MSRLQSRLKELRAAGTKALVTFITGGDPDPFDDGAGDARTGRWRCRRDRGGRTVFGPRGRRSGNSAQFRTRAVRWDAIARHTRHRSANFANGTARTPVLLMGYLNSVERMGYRTFVDRAAAAGVDGLIIVNLPPEESDELRGLMRTPRPRPDLSGRADDHARTHRVDCAACERLHLLRRVERCDRCKPPDAPTVSRSRSSRSARTPICRS